MITSLNATTKRYMWIAVIWFTEDEVPIILNELNDAAYNYIEKEHYEKALILLIKANGILDKMDLKWSWRDKNLALITFQNMAMCYQKQGLLQECAFCLNKCLEYLHNRAGYEKSIGARMNYLRWECKYWMQLCAISS